MPLLWLSLAFLCGVLLGELSGWMTAVWLGIAAGAILAQAAASGLRARRHLPRFARFFTETYTFLPQVPLPGLALLAALTLGAARFAASQPANTPQFIAWYNDQPVPYVAEGVVSGLPDERQDYTNLRVQIEQIHPKDEQLFKPVDGLLLTKVPPGGQWRYGDRVRLQGYLKTPFEGETFSYREYLARQGVYSVLSCNLRPEQAQEECIQRLGYAPGNPLLALVYSLRGHALEMIYRLLPDPEAALLAGILVGMESGIPADLQRAFQDTGTSHIIAISGFNFTLVSGLFVLVFNRWLGRWRGSLAALIGIAVYAVLVGASAGVVRAALMSGLALGARQLGRQQHGLNSLGITAAVMAVFDPAVLWDVSFQLSFMATLGLVLYADRLGKAFIRFLVENLRIASASLARKISGPVGEYFLFTLAAQVTTLPVTVYHFHRLPVSSLVANPLILPAQPPIMLLGGLAVLLGALFQPLGELAASLCWPFLAYTTRMVEWLAGLPLGTLVFGKVSLPVVAAFYLALFAWTFAGKSLKLQASQAAATTGPSWFQSLLQKAAWPVLVALAAPTLIVWQAALNAPDGRLHLTVLDVGSGDALLVQTPGGRNLLIDGGPSPNRLSDALGRRLPFLGRQLDYLVIAAAGEEQTAALPEILARFPPAQALWAGPPAGTLSARQLQIALGQAKIPIITAQTGQALDLGQGARLEVLDASGRGAVLLLEWGRFRALLPVGMDFDAMERLQNDYRQAPLTALLLAESGYAPLNTPEWIRRWQPQVALLSVGAGDRQGRPDADTLAAVQGFTLLRTDRNGWIHLSTDGERLWVEVEK